MDGRWVFRVWHAQNRPAGAPVVRSAALDSSGSRVCLGLEDGSLEEHRVGPEGSLTLAARKHLGKKVRTSMQRRPWAWSGRVGVCQRAQLQLTPAEAA